MEKDKDLENIYILMEINLLGIGIIINKKVMVSFFLKAVIFITVNLCRGSLKVLEFINIFKVENNIKDFGKMISGKGRVFIKILMVIF
jgi:hypothetical protein